MHAKILSFEPFYSVIVVCQDVADCNQRTLAT